MKKIKNWFYKPVFTLICYLLAILLLVYALFTMKNSYDYINSFVLQGSVSWSEDLTDIISYFIGNSVSYLFYAFSFLFFGKVINLLNPKQIKEEIIENEIIEDNDQLIKENEDKLIEEGSNDKLTEESDDEPVEEKDDQLEEVVDNVDEVIEEE